MRVFLEVLAEHLLLHYLCRWILGLCAGVHKRSVIGAAIGAGQSLFGKTTLLSSHHCLWEQGSCMRHSFLLPLQVDDAQWHHPKRVTKDVTEAIPREFPGSVICFPEPWLQLSKERVPGSSNSKQYLTVAVRMRLPFVLEGAWRNAYPRVKRIKLGESGERTAPQAWNASSDYLHSILCTSHREVHKRQMKYIHWHSALKTAK